MKKSFNRREFLKSSIKGLGTLTLLGSPLKLFAGQSSSSSGNSPTLDADILYKQAKLYFRKKEYSLATGLYNQLISSYPNRIIYYDGYAKVLGAQQKALDVAELYRVGLQKNSSSPHFKHRFALSIRNLCTGNHKGELAFVSKYGQDNLMALSATLLLEAIALKPIKGYMMDLRDFQPILENLNKRNRSPISIEASLINNIQSVTSFVNSKWLSTRKSRTPFIENVDAEVEKIKNKSRRDLYIETEKDSRKKETKKVVKERWKSGLIRNINSNNIYLVEKYGLLILRDNIEDTDTIGKLRKYYRKQKTYDRIINLDRNLYVNNGTHINALALASSLAKYSTSAVSLTEAKQLLSIAKPYINTLPAVNTTSYYLTLSRIKLKENQPTEARNALLEGIKLYDGRGGLSYALMENYAMSYLNAETDKGIALMKVLCGKGQKEQDPVIAPFVKNYLDFIKEKPLSISEQIKGLSALAKLQQKSDSAEYSSTLSEINTLKGKLNLH